jgi:hypothetical protein
MVTKHSSSLINDVGSGEISEREEMYMLPPLAPVTHMLKHTHIAIN